MASTATATSNRLRNQFRGCLVGAVLGDCLGAKFEDTSIEFMSLKKVQKFTQNAYKNEQIYLYTDDTAMAKSIADSLIHCGGFNGKDMAKRFAEEYFHDPSRYYGGHIPLVFKKLQDSNYSDPEGPASEQFNGQGSYGNGSAMRVAPVALFTHNGTIEETQSLATKTSRITHTHPQAINGAIMETLAIRECFGIDATKSLDAFAFLDKMLILMENLEHTLPMDTTTATAGMDETEKNAYILSHLKNATASMEGRCSTYVESLVRIYRLLNGSKSIKSETVYKTLGNGIAAIEAVPAALMAFLCIARDKKKSFMDVIEYAISFGDDTDTIATMAGAIAGCYYGYESLPKHWIEKCEGTTDALTQADKLCDHITTT